MRALPLALAASLIAGTASVGSAAADHAKKRSARVEDWRADDRRVVERAHFPVSDARVIREYYEPRSRRLPPGLQKKLQRTGTLPPGWQKKLQPFPRTVERRLSRLPSDYRRGFYDGYAVIYEPRTHRIVDVDGPYWR